MTEADYTDDLPLLANAAAQAEYLLYSLEQAAESSGIYMKANKTKFMCFKLDEAIFSEIRPVHIAR